MWKMIILTIMVVWKNIIKAFEQFVNQLPSDGRAVIGLDCPVLREMLPRVSSQCVTFALHDSKADYTTSEIHYQGFGSSTQVFCRGQLLGDLHLAVPGEYNVANALAAVATLHSLGFAFADIAAGLAAFKGTVRRFEKLGQDTARQITVYDDYAHHPSEIKALLQGARNLAAKRLVVVFSRIVTAERSFCSENLPLPLTSPTFWC